MSFSHSELAVSQISDRRNSFDVHMDLWTVSHVGFQVLTAASMKMVVF
jgi:hypothetical protein